MTQKPMDIRLLPRLMDLQAEAIESRALLARAEEMLAPVWEHSAARLVSEIREHLGRWK